MQEIFLHFFEQYGAVTLLLLFCGCKGNGKSLRAERAKAVFPEGWAADGGMSSARAGMNGGNSTMNGCNVLYDEMIGDLCDSEGSDRLEFWKYAEHRFDSNSMDILSALPCDCNRQIVLKREYTYQRTTPVKGPDGRETHQTMRLRTAHDETHLM